MFAGAKQSAVEVHSVVISSTVGQSTILLLNQAKSDFIFWQSLLPLLSFPAPFKPRPQMFFLQFLRK